MLIFLFSIGHVGVLKLELNQDPLKSWVQTTAAGAAGELSGGSTDQDSWVKADEASSRSAAE